mgnify:CR=1 FL=1
MKFLNKSKELFDEFNLILYDEMKINFIILELKKVLKKLKMN